MTIIDYYVTFGIVMFILFMLRELEGQRKIGYPTILNGLFVSFGWPLLIVFALIYVLSKLYSKIGRKLEQ